MKHEDAIRNKSVDRYLLREMAEDEERIFEEHFFGCAVCGADVTDATRMMIAGRAVVEEERDAASAGTSNVVPMPKPKRAWWLPAAVAASLILPLLGGQVGYLVAMRRHDSTELVRVVTLRGPSRAGRPAGMDVIRPGEGVRFDVDPSDVAVEYAAVVTCGGKTQSTHRIGRKVAADAVTLRIGELPAGRCEVVVQGVRKDGKRFGITSYPFQVGER